VSAADTDALAGRIAVVTGGNSGIGKETVAALAQQGATVVIAARNEAKATAAVDEIRARTGAGDRVETMPLDLASFASVREFVAAFRNRHDRLDILVNNAGLLLRTRVETVDGHETQFQVNHLGHFLLTNSLRDLLVAAAPARVVNVSSVAHSTVRHGLDFDDLDWRRRRYRRFAVYSSTKLANVYFTRELARRWDGDAVSVNAVHPGWVGTNFGREGDAGRIWDIATWLAKPFALSSEQGAQTSIYVASSPDATGITGQYFVKGRVTGPSAIALDDRAAERLWRASEQMTT
jgi:NAD(P)-dependent dehydrogenase (short-subunit alcohol dehydrogenase family)